MIALIDDNLIPSLKEDNPVAAKESLRSRALVIEHLKKLNYPKIYLVNSLEEMLEVSLAVYSARKSLSNYGRFNLRESR